MEHKTSTIERISETQEKSSPPPQLMKKMKLKRADHELRKCIGNEKVKETVLKSYSCAWQKDILVHGRLHLTQSWICFYSNILGWETKACISLKTITAISKQKTALVFPNAILVEVSNKKYGFTSFVHRDRTYKVLHVIWQNSQLEQPSSGDALKALLSQAKQLRQSPTAERKSKSASFTGDSSDVESVVSSTSPSHSPSHSQPSTPYTSYSHLPIPQSGHTSHSQPSTPQTITTRFQHQESSQFNHSDSTDPLTPTRQLNPDQIDGELSGFEMQPPSSACSSDSSEKGSRQPSPVCQHQSSEEDSLCATDSSTYLDSQPSSPNAHSLSRSPSLITLKPSRSELDSIPGPALLGGSPNYLHHWKQIVSVATYRQTLFSITTQPQHLLQLCTPSRLINTLILLFIALLLLSTVSLLCQLSHVEPALQPYLGWQPWCSCLHAANAGVINTLSGVS